MKLILNSAFSSGLLLMGISFVYGATGSLNFTEITPKLESSTLLLFAFVLLTSGFGFKISAVPFHLWTADVYQGAPVPVTSYLSVISKGSLFFVFVSVLYTLFKPLSNDWYPVICLLAILTMVVGNLFALRQTNIKRLLAFSSIAQAGFILVGISANSVVGLSSVVYFILVYIFSNLGAFGVVSVISACTGKENINDYRGLYKTNPLLAWVLAISLFSLAGIPPTAGFFGKFFLLIAGAARNNYSLIIIAALNMVVSLYYYLVLVKTIFLNGDDSKMETLPIPMLSRIALLICVAGILVLGLYGNVYDYIQSVCSNF
jgi:NADH-quinone oxidoreductase subunit N